MDFLLQEAQRLFEMQPKAITEVRKVLEDTLEKVDKDAFFMDEIEINNYNVNVTVRCYNDETPTKYVRALIDADYFDDITYNGFSGEEIGEDQVLEFFTLKSSKKLFLFFLV